MNSTTTFTANQSDFSPVVIAPKLEFEAIGLQALLIAEKLRRGLISPTDAAIELVSLRGQP
jgi:hypothetical protein